MNLKEKVKSLPSTPGVYLMKDSLNSVIYVGKSKNLKSRVSSYFQNLKSHSKKVVNLVNNLKDLEYILTDTEFEAFMLECKLIKEIKPMYNKQMKNPKSYTYIKIDRDKPDIEISSEANNNDGNLYFGPYSSKNTVERGLQGIKEYYKILCSNNNSRKTTSCLNYSLGLCIGICRDDFPKERYLAIIEKITALLNGKDKSILPDMENIMNMASEKLDFETALKYRDYINAINYLISKARVVKFTKKNKNIAVIEYLSEDTLKFFLIKGNTVLYAEKYKHNTIGYKELKEILKNKISYFLKGRKLKNPIVIEKEKIDEAQIIYRYLKNKSSTCKHVVIPAKWINSQEDADLDKALDKLFDSISRK